MSKQTNRSFLALLLSLCLMLSLVTPAMAAGEETVDGARTEQIGEDAALEAYLASLEPLTVTPADADGAVEREDDAAEPAEYTPGIVLFSAKADVAVESLGLERLGIAAAEPVLTEGTAVDTDSGEAVWYRASCSGDAAAAAADLKQLPGVIDAELEYIYYSDSYGEPKEVEVGKNWAFDALLKTANKIWWSTELSQKINPGEGTVVAVIDTGVDYTHEDLRANMWINDAELNGLPGVDDDGDGYIDDIYGVNVTASGARAGDPMDDNGHGTHVAGIIAMTSNGKGGVGLAWGSKIMAVKAGQSTGTFTSSDIAKAIDYARMKGADVINMSFGGTEKSYLIEQALAKAFSTCVLVASAGNDGIPTTDAPDDFVRKADIYPAGYPYVLGVMATGKDGSLAGFSNWDYTNNANCEYELTAPGVELFSTLPGNRYATWSGTSMAAPCVAAAAAIVRSNYADKDTYSSRFIMGQLASATERTTSYVDAIGGLHTYAALDILQSCKKLPQPNINIQNVFALDNVRGDNEVNDGDRILDAGETIDLGFTVRNQWGQTGAITVTADAMSVAGVANPYVTFLNDTVTLEPAGTFGESDNGNVWDDGYLTAVTNPITFRLAKDTPNDAEICITLTARTANDFDARDTAVYTAEYQYTFTVQNGRAIRGRLTEDTTLTNDYYWIVENTVLIPEGITLTVEPGTQLQFWSSDYEDAYGGKTMAGIINYGTLNMVGTEEQPISCFPGRGFSNYVVEISGGGVETLQYCDIKNPRLGFTGTSNSGWVDKVDHCRLTQNQSINYIRYLSGNRVVTEYGWFSEYGFGVKLVSNTQMNGLRTPYSNGCRYIKVKESRENCYNDCSIIFWTNGANNAIKTNDLLLQGNGGSDTERRSSSFEGATAVPVYDSAALIDSAAIRTYDGAEHQYVFLPMIKGTDGTTQYDLAKALAESMGGTLLCLDSKEEEDFVYETMHDFAEATRQDNTTNTIFCEVWLGYRQQPETGEYVWDDGGSYTPKVTFRQFSGQDKYTYLQIYSYPTGFSPFFQSSASISGGSLMFFALELPAVNAEGVTMSEEEIRAALKTFDTDVWLFDYRAPGMTNCAILNPVLNTVPESWARITAPSYSESIRCYNLTGNYWGTENTALINKMIVDADDFAGTLGDIVEQPILTRDDDLSAIYPFVTGLTVEDADGNTVDTVSPGAAYTVRVRFNRDMDETAQPSVTYGPAAPYTDFVVRGEWVSAREWVGETVISPVMTAGTQYFKTLGGRAASDHWLVCGSDILRYAMTVSATGVQAMLLQAAGGANKVELSWAQNDYDTLAGYNLYRSETGKDGSFRKLNSTVLTENSYTDTAVEAGKTYYYYFTVVNTEGNEEDARSNTASAAPIDNVAPVLRHTPVESARAGRQTAISATVTDNISVAGVTLYYRRCGETTYRSSEMVATGTGNGYSAVIPADYVTAAGTEYYITAQDGDGNIAYCGTAELPNFIAVDGSVFISGLMPSTVSVEGGQTITILGGNFTEDMELKVGGTKVTAYELKGDDQLTFTAPAMPIGVYAVTLTRNGVQTGSKTSLSYTDASVMAQIPTDMKMVAGESFEIPLYITTRGAMSSFHAELDFGGMGITALQVKKADDNVPFRIEFQRSGSTVSISAIGSENIAAEEGKALVKICVTPSAVISDQTYTVALRAVRCNGAPVETVIGGTAMVRPNYSLSVSVSYYAGEKKPVPGVTIQVGGKSGTTDERGRLTLTGIPVNQVTVQALRGDGVRAAVTANDAVLVLKSSVGMLTLSAQQELAADVDGCGGVNEQDAALILQMAVRKIDQFPIGMTWRFDPASRTMTLRDGTNSVSFTAILVGDVDGSWNGESA